ncbi:MAG TPA: hypothetical protein DEA55_00480 [Rhodospirillaceae bacterium]|nr:hypothetical protein [Rhodospirillaceae bacterium]
MPITRLMLLSLTLLVFPLQAFAIECLPEEAPVVKLRSAIADTKFVRSNSIRDLTKVHGSPQQKSKKVLGTGGGAMSIKANLRFRTATQGRKSCVSLKEIKAEYVSYPEIHIASNFRKGSCAYNAVLEHEEKHIAILKEFHNEYSQKLKADMENLAMQINVTGPVAAKDVQKVQDEASADLYRWIDSFTRQASLILEQRQAKIDTEEEYKKMSSLCKDMGRSL